MLVEEKGMKSVLNSFNTVLKKSFIGKELWEEAEKIFAQVTLHRIPTFPREQSIRKFAVLENDLWTEQTTKCLIVKDLTEDVEETIEMVEELLKENNITGITKIMPLNQLKKEYKGYELKRNLAKAYDVFLADSRINRLALGHLGKEFYQRRKIPHSVDLESPKRLKMHVENLGKSTQIILTSKGPNINIQFGHTLMKDEEKFENLKSLLSQLNGIIPRGDKNIKVISLQGLNTVALPLYRNNNVDPTINEMSGIELERKATYDQIAEMREEVKPRFKKGMKDTRKRTKKSKGKRKLLQIKEESEGPAKKTKTESESA